MRKDNIALLALFLLTVMAFSLVPVRAFIYPDGSVDGLYEDFGPRLDRLQVIMYDGTDPMWTGLLNQEIDLGDWPLTATWITTFSGSANHLVTSYGGEAGMYELDFNLNNNYWLGNPAGDPINPATNYPYPNPVSQGPGNATQNVCSDLNFRRGVSYLFNRTRFQGVIAGWGIMIYTPVPSYMGSPNPGEGAVNQDIRPGGSLEALTYPYNVANAQAEFAAANIKIVAGQNGDKRFWDRNMNNIADAGEDILLNMNIRQDTGRRRAGEFITEELVALGFKTDTQYITGGQNYQETMLDKNYHITTFGWINMGPDPDFLYDLYHETGHWHDPESSAPNTQFLNDPATNHWGEAIKFNNTAEGARLSAWKFQEAFATVAAQIPLWSNDGYKATSKTYVGAPGVSSEDQYEGDTWNGLCNQMGQGSNSFYSFFNAYPTGHEFSSGDMTIRAGWKETGYPQHINPLYSEWYWDAEVLSKIYDGLGYRDPYALSNWKPYLIENWTVGTWMDGAIEKSKVKITLRPNVKWADGVALTVDDVIYSLTQVAHDLVNNGYPPPWSWPTTENVQSAYALDPYNIEILFAVQSFLAQSWALGGFYIIPKHVWQPIVATGDPTQFAADPNVIGSGPWRYVSMTTGVSLLMVANRPGSVVTTDRPGATAKTSPGVFSGEPVDVQVYEQSYLAKFLNDSVNDLTYVVKLKNNWMTQSVTVNKTVTITVPDEAPIVSTTNGIVIAAGGTHTETFSVSRANYGKQTATVTVTYMKGATLVTGTVVLDPWITIPEDIGGGVLPGSSPPYPVPDFKVEGRDIAVASRAFGTKPGMLRWSPIADITGDYKIDGKDIARLAKKFGWTG